MSDPRYLRAKIVLLLSKEERICEDRAFQIPSEHHFDIARRLKILETEVWQLRPLAKRVVRNEVSEFVNSLALGFLFGLTLSAFRLSLFSTLDISLNDVVVLIQPVDFSKEAERLGCSISCKLFERFLEAVGFLLAKANTRPLINLTLSHQVLHSAHWRAGIRFFASLFACLGLFRE